MFRPQSAEDKIGDEVTKSLKRMLETMRTEVERSSVNISTAKETTRNLQGTTENYENLSGTLEESRGLIRDLWKKNRNDMIYIFGALGVFIATAVWVILQRTPGVVWLPGKIILRQLGNFVPKSSERAGKFVDRVVEMTEAVLSDTEDAPEMFVDRILKKEEYGNDDLLKHEDLKEDSNVERSEPEEKNNVSDVDNVKVATEEQTATKAVAEKNTTASEVGPTSTVDQVVIEPTTTDAYNQKHVKIEESSEQVAAVTVERISETASTTFTAAKLEPTTISTESETQSTAVEHPVTVTESSKPVTPVMINNVPEVLEIPETNSVESSKEVREEEKIDSNEKTPEVEKHAVAEVLKEHVVDNVEENKISGISETDPVISPEFSDNVDIAQSAASEALKVEPTVVTAEVSEVPSTVKIPEITSAEIAKEVDTNSSPTDAMINGNISAEPVAPTSIPSVTISGAVSSVINEEIPLTIAPTKSADTTNIMTESAYYTANESDHQSNYSSDADLYSGVSEEKMEL